MSTVNVAFPQKNIFQTFAAFPSTWKTITMHQMIGCIQFVNVRVSGQVQ